MSESLTECEFTDSEGRPNPFHKQLDVPQIVIESGSPSTNFDNVAPAGQRVYPHSESEESEIEIPGHRFKSPSYTSRYQYKTPNVQDRLKKSEETRVGGTVRSAQRALSLKKNWVSHDSQNGDKFPKKGDSAIDKAPNAMDERLKSLVDRLSSQQSLLKPASKPSSQMEHFLKKTTSVQSSMNNSSMATAGKDNNTTKSSPFRNSIYSNYPLRPSLTTSISCNPITSPAESKIEPKVTIPVPLAKEEDTNNIEAAVEQKHIKKVEPVVEEPTINVFTDVVSIQVPDIPVLEGKEPESDCAKVDFEDESEPEDEKVEPSQDSTNKTDELFHSCLDEPTEDKTLEEQSKGSSMQSYHTPGKDLDGDGQEVLDTSPQTSSPQASTPQASSTPVAEEENANGTHEESPPEVPRRKPTLKLTEDEVTKIYQERNPLERLAKLNSLKRKQSSFVHDMIVNRGTPANRTSARPRTRLPISQKVAPPPIPPQPSDESLKTALTLDFPLIDAESSSDLPSPKEPPAPALPATPLTDPAKFGIPVPRNATRKTLPKAPPRASRPAVLNNVDSPSKASALRRNVAPTVSPDISQISNDMDGILSSEVDSSVPNSPSKRSTGSAGSNKKNFMKTISGIFKGGKPVTLASPEELPKTEPENVSPERKSRSDTFIRFAKGFRSSSARPSATNSPEKTLKKHPTSFRTGSLTMRATHPSTPPVPLSRKITLKNHFGSSDESLSDMDEDTSVDSSLNVANEVRKVSEHQKPLRTSALPPEILDKLMRRGGKNAARSMKVAQLKRVRKAQEIHRQLEELDVKHKELEEKGIIAERSLRGEEDIDIDGENYDSELMQTWFHLLAEKNALIRQEQELLVKAKHLELEDRSAKLEMELREHHLLLDSQDVAREDDILKELLDISEQRELLQSMLAKDKKRYQEEDLNIERQMKAKGLSVKRKISQ